MKMFCGLVVLLDVVVGTCFPNYFEWSNIFVCVTGKLLIDMVIAHYLCILFLLFTFFMHSFLFVFAKEGKLNEVKRLFPFKFMPLIYFDPSKVGWIDNSKSWNKEIFFT
jgi:hypothetical protein